MNNPASAPVRRRKRRGPVLFQLLLVAGFLALVWFSFGQNVLAPSKQAGVPERLGSLKLIRSIEGPEALAQVRKLHGGDVGLVSAYIVHYAADGDRATVWIGTGESGDAAAELTRQMVKAIEEGDTSFSHPQRLSIAGQEVFQVEGPGGEHFFYNSTKLRERVVWLTIEAADARSLLERAVKIF
jgi:hypothetical protein